MNELLYRPIESENFPEIPWSKIRENPFDRSPFSNFLNYSSKELPQINPSIWLLNKIINHNDLYNQFRNQDEWNTIFLTGFFSNSTLFLEKLMLLMHITGGQPARSFELFSIQYGNSVSTGLRNVFFDQGLISFVTSYHKGFSTSESTKIIHRFLPIEVGELFVYYLWLLVPFIQRIYTNFPGQIPFSEYLFRKIGFFKKSKKTEFNSDDLRRIICRETLIGLKQSINPSQYRYIAIGITRKFLRKKSYFNYDQFDLEADFEDEDDIFDL